MPKVTVPTCHIEKLKQLGIYDQWLSNIKTRVKDLKQHCRNLSGTSWKTFISGSFIWDCTPEGGDFWQKIENS